MFIELHAIQNFVPATLNRDDNNSPKSCMFGGVSRARISSQSWKRAMRTYFRDAKALDDEKELGYRTRLLPSKVAEKVAKRLDMPQEDALALVRRVLEDGGIPFEKDGSTKIVLFVGKETVDQLAESIAERVEALNSKDKKNAVRKAAIDGLGDILLQSARIPHVALFGRMIEVKNSTPFGEKNLGAEGVAQVAHPFSTHKVENEGDYFTAVDDFNPQGEAAASMIGIVEFNSACYYRYANLDVTALQKVLDDNALAYKTAKAFIEAFQFAVPIGKQKGTAPQNPPSFTLAVVREAGGWSLANAFAKPVTLDEDLSDLISGSIARLDRYWQNLRDGYGDDQLTDFCCFAPDNTGITQLKDARELTFTKYVQRTLGAAFPEASV